METQFGRGGTVFIVPVFAVTSTWETAFPIDLKVLATRLEQKVLNTYLEAARASGGTVKVHNTATTCTLSRGGTAFVGRPGLASSEAVAQPRRARHAAFVSGKPRLDASYVLKDVTGVAGGTYALSYRAGDAKNKSVEREKGVDFRELAEKTAEWAAREAAREAADSEGGGGVLSRIKSMGRSLKAHEIETKGVLVE